MVALLALWIEKGKYMVSHSIFNDVLGPIMAGPSSSHSAGCARIGRMTRLLWGREIKKAVVVYDSQGSYPSTCVGQGSNFGFTGGLLGFSNDEPRMKDSIAIAKEIGVDISFSEEKLSARHPNEARIDVYGDSGEVELSVLTLSVGGGMFQIVEMDRFPVFMDGSREQIYVCCEASAAESVAETLEFSFKKIKKITRLEREPEKHELEREESAKNWKADENICLICAEEHRGTEADRKSVENVMEELQAIAGVRYVRKAHVVLPIPMKPENRAVFSTAEEVILYMKSEAASEEEKQLWELAMEYECSLGEVTPEDVWKQAEHTLQVMRNAAVSPDPEATEMFGFLPYQSANMKKRAEAGRNESSDASVEQAKRTGFPRTVNTGYLDKAMFYALAVMENSCAHNIVTASPTAGSSGVVPAAVVAVGEEMGCTDEEIMKGLLAAGLAGAFIANQATFGAEVAGCQAENGAASAMAAAGVIQLLGGTVQQGFAAASLALQNMLGLICDPVGGLTEIPCISRNVAAMSNAVMSANMVMLGFDAIIPYDETIQTMYEVGKQLPSALRCTCEGGLCVTRTARKIADGLKGR